MIWRIEHRRLNLWIKLHNNGGQDGYSVYVRGMAINGSCVDAAPHHEHRIS